MDDGQTSKHLTGHASLETGKKIFDYRIDPTPNWSTYRLRFKRIPSIRRTAEGISQSSVQVNQKTGLMAADTPRSKPIRVSAELDPRDNHVPR